MLQLDVTIQDLFDRSFAQNAGKCALKTSDRSLSYDELESLTRKLARVLETRYDLTVGDRVAVSASATVGATAVHLALVRMGVSVVPLSTAYSREELLYILRTSGARSVIAFNEDHHKRSAGVVDTVEGDRLLQLASVSSEGELSKSPPASSETLVVFSSGTTGRPKAVPATTSAVAHNLVSLADMWGLSSSDSLYLALPLYHIHGLVVGLYGILSVGGTIHLHEKYDPAVLAAQLETGEADVFFGVPTMYQRLLRSGHASSLRNARLCVSGSAPLTKALFTEIKSASDVSVVERYGMTETLIISSNVPRTGVRPGSVGVPLRSTQVTIADDQEILVQGPSVFNGYIGSAGNSCTVPFATGDLGYLQDGYLYINGRKRDLIITGGHNVHPLEVEEAIQEIDGVLEAAVVGRHSTEWGEEVVAFVVPVTPMKTETLRTYLKERLSYYKVPKSIYFVEALPRNHLGKIDRKTLQESLN